MNFLDNAVVIQNISSMKKIKFLLHSNQCSLLLVWTLYVLAFCRSPIYLECNQIEKYFNDNSIANILKNVEHFCCLNMGRLNEIIVDEFEKILKEKEIVKK
ncbi:hypothetical protein RFI_31103 [Reticulomyxa filosa]|uniref:Uncharacterized protein n=1 Tax=Reticulomyxa filosa TaxID=46433 RepID=X6LWI5_RETFI|nr:hypothetical protein RFI_31103 [Reticulomyxa filosa]|eukprot:ETO06293.1 hypothetical protein RFI_31103 [Reticulomyxa filosa]